MRHTAQGRASPPQYYCFRLGWGASHICQRSLGQCRLPGQGLRAPLGSVRWDTSRMNLFSSAALRYLVGLGAEKHYTMLEEIFTY